MNPPALLVQNWVILRPNYYMKYYRPGAGESLVAPDLPPIDDQPIGQDIYQDIHRDARECLPTPHGF